MRPTNRSRLHNDHFHSLIGELRKKDLQWYFKYFRMTPARFDDLLAKVEPYIFHSLTHKVPIGAAERLALTLR